VEDIGLHSVHIVKPADRFVTGNHLVRQGQFTAVQQQRSGVGVDAAVVKLIGCIQTVVSAGSAAEDRKGVAGSLLDYLAERHGEGSQPVGQDEAQGRVAFEAAKAVGHGRE
jgi:hypothetical protein